MNLDLIRAIDKWVGIPACFAVSLAHKVRDFCKGQEQNEPMQEKASNKVLFLELSEMGSAVLAYPAMKYVLRRHPGTELYFLVFEQNRFSVDMLDIMPKDHVRVLGAPEATVRYGRCSVAKRLEGQATIQLGIASAGVAVVRPHRSILQFPKYSLQLLDSAVQKTSG